MSVYVVYHNTENEDLQRIPFAAGHNPFDRFFDDWVSNSRESTLRQAVAERGWCLFIVGLGKPKRFYLWGYFQFLPGTVAKTGGGEGWMLNPPQRLEGAAFRQFKDVDCSQFGSGLQNVSDSPFVARLVSVASEFHRPKITRETLRFCSELLSLTKGGGALAEDARALEQYVKKALGRSASRSKPAAKNGKAPSPRHRAPKAKPAPRAAASSRKKPSAVSKKPAKKSLARKRM